MGPGSATPLVTLEDFRSQESWNNTFEYILQVASHLLIQAVPPRIRQRRIPQRLLDDFVITDTTGNRQPCSDMDIKEQYKTSFYFPVLDCFISQLKHRFSSFNLDIMNAIQACSPQSTKFLDSTTLRPLVTLYNFDSAAIANEALLAKNTLSNCSMELHNIKDVIKQLMPLKPAWYSKYSQPLNYRFNNCS